MKFQCHHINRTGTQCLRRPNWFYTDPSNLHTLFTCTSHKAQDSIKNPEAIFQLITKEIYEKKFKRVEAISKQSDTFYKRECLRREMLFKK